MSMEEADAAPHGAEALLNLPDADIERICAALAGVSCPPATVAKRLCRSLAGAKAGMLTLRQRDVAIRLVYRFRRQVAPSVLKLIAGFGPEQLKWQK